MCDNNQIEQNSSKAFKEGWIGDIKVTFCLHKVYGLSTYEKLRTFGV